MAETKGRVMATFRICLVGGAQPLLVDLPVSSISELADASASSRFLTGHMVEPDEQGVCPAVMIAASRIQCAFEAG